MERVHGMQLCMIVPPEIEAKQKHARMKHFDVIVFFWVRLADVNMSIATSRNPLPSESLSS